MKHKPASMPQQRAQALPYGCMTGYSKDVLRMIPRCATAGRAKDLMTLIATDAFGNAGFETEHPDEAGLWCNMDTAGWAALLGVSKQFIVKLKNQLIALGMISEHVVTEDKKQAPLPKPDDWRAYVSCRLRINPNFTEWQPLQSDYRRQRYTRAGAGRPRKSPQADERKPFDSDKLPAVNRLISDSRPAQATPGITVLEGETVSTIGNNSNGLRLVGKSKSNGLRQPAEKVFKRFTVGSSESAAEQAAEAPVIKITEEVITEEESPYGDALAVPDAPTASPSTATSSRKGKTPQGQDSLFGSIEGTTPVPPAGRKKPASKTGITQEQIDALWNAWEVCGPRVIQRRNIGNREWGRHVKAMTDLVIDGITPEMIAALVAAKHEQWKWKKDPYVLKPGDISSDLATLRPIACGEVAVTATSNGHSQKGANHAGLRRHTGEYIGNHGRDADLVQRC